MHKRLLRCVGVIVLSFVCGASAGAADSVPKLTDLLFNRPHIAEIAAGTILTYKFERKPSNEKMLGEGFTDNITVKIESDGKPGKKNVRVQIYSGDRAREPQLINNMDANPMLVVFLDTAVAHYRMVAGGDGAYLKGMFSRYLAKHGTITPAKITYKGQEVDGYQIKAVPYAEDAARAKMNGYENSEFTLALSEKIPGYFAQMISTYKSTDSAAPSLIETTTLDGVESVK